MKTTLTAAAVNRVAPPKRGRRYVWDSVVPGLALRITASGSRSWVVMTRLRGSQLLHTLGSAGGKDESAPISLVSARELAREALELVARGQDPRDRRKPVDQVPGTFATVAEEFISKSTAGAGWKIEQARILRKNVIPVLGSKRVDEIRRGDVISLLERIIAARKPTLANRTKAVVSKVFSWALDRELIEAHPCTRLGSIMPKERQRERVLSQQEIGTLWHTWESMAYPFGWFAELLLVTLQRRGEVATMRWADIDFGTRTWSLRKTKAGHGHEVPLSDMAIDILGKVPRVDGSEFVFPARRRRYGVQGRDSERFERGSFRGFSSGTRLAKSKSGFDDWRLHDLRRTGATNMARLGIPKETISRVLNHAEGGVTSIYARHSYLDEKRRALDSWATTLRGFLVAEAKSETG